MLNAITLKPNVAWMLQRGLVISIEKPWAPLALHGYYVALHAGRPYAGPTAEVRALLEVADVARRRGHYACTRWTSRGAIPELIWMTSQEREEGRLSGHLVTCHDFPTSSIFATATLRLYGHGTGSYVWCFEHIIAVPGGVPCAGRQGMWNVDSSLANAIVEARHPELRRAGGDQ